MVMAADRVPVHGMRVPGEAPAAVDVAVVLMPPHQYRGEDRAAGADPAPELVAVPLQRIEPTEHAAILRMRSDA